MEFKFEADGEVTLRPTAAENLIIRKGIRKILLRAMTAPDEIYKQQTAHSLMHYYDATATPRLGSLGIVCSDRHIPYFALAIEAALPDLDADATDVASQALGDIQSADIERQVQEINLHIPDFMPTGSDSQE